MGVHGIGAAVLVETVDRLTQPYPQTFFPLVRKNPRVIPIIHTSTTSTKVFLK